MKYERPHHCIVQIVWDTLDADGNVVGERADPAEKILWPFGASLDRRLLEREREMILEARPKLPQER
jgi:hypothetical protein